MTGSAPRINRVLSTPEFFALATARLSLDVPEGLTDPNVIPRHGDLHAEPAVMAAIAAAPPSRTAAVLLPIIARAEPTVLFTQRTTHLGDHAGQVSFPGGKIEADDVPAKLSIPFIELPGVSASDKYFVRMCGRVNSASSAVGMCASFQTAP